MTNFHSRAVAVFVKPNTAFALWLAVNLALAVFAAWGVNRGSWPSSDQLVSLGLQTAQVAVAGFLVFNSNRRVAMFACGLTFAFLAGLLTEHFDEFYDSRLLTILRFRHLAIIFGVGLIAGRSTRTVFSTTRKQSSELAFSLRAMFLLVFAVAALLALKVACPDPYEFFQQHGLLPLLPFYWPVSICFGLAASIGPIAACSDARIGTRVACGALAAAALGLLPPFYYFGRLRFPADAGWTIQMIATALIAAIIYATYLLVAGRASNTVPTNSNETGSVTGRP